MDRLRDLLTAFLIHYIRRSPSLPGRAFLYRRVVDALLVRWPRQSVVATQQGDRMHCDTNDVIQRRIFAFGVWEPGVTAFISSRLKRGDTFVDVGANVGYFSVMASRLVGSTGNVVAFEPSPSIRGELLANLKLNACSNVRVSDAAVSNVVSSAVVHRAPDHNRGSSSLLASRQFEPETVVQTAPLSTLLSDAEWASVRVIKVDVEGLEAQVLEGLLGRLGGARADLEIVVEISMQEVAAQGYDTLDLVRRLARASFNAYLMQKANHAYWPRAFKPLIPGLVRLPDVGTHQFVFSRRDAAALVVLDSASA